MSRKGAGRGTSLPRTLAGAWTLPAPFESFGARTFQSAAGWSGGNTEQKWNRHFFDSVSLMPHESHHEGPSAAKARRQATVHGFEVRWGMWEKTNVGCRAAKSLCTLCDTARATTTSRARSTTETMKRRSTLTRSMLSSFVTYPILLSERNLA